MWHQLVKTFTHGKISQHPLLDWQKMSAFVAHKWCNLVTLVILWLSCSTTMRLQFRVKYLDNCWGAFDKIWFGHSRPPHRMNGDNFADPLTFFWCHHRVKISVCQKLCFMTKYLQHLEFSLQSQLYFVFTAEYQILASYDAKLRWWTW